MLKIWQNIFREKYWAHNYAFKRRKKEFLITKITKFIFVIYNIHLKYLLFKFINLKKKTLLFIHTPKCGGTSVSHSMKNQKFFFNLSHSVIRKNFSDKTIPIGLIGKNINKNKNNLFFSTVRNPFFLLRSYYHHVLTRNINTNHYDYESATKGFEYFIENIMNRDNAWPSRKFLFPVLFNDDSDLVCDYIFRIENFNNEINLVKDIQIKKIELINVSKHKEENLKYYFSDKLITEVKSVYRREFAMFGYNNFSFDKKDKKQLLGDTRNFKIKYNYQEDKIINF